MSQFPELRIASLLTTPVRMGLAGPVLLRTEETLQAQGLGSSGTLLSWESHALGPLTALPVLNTWGKVCACWLSPMVMTSHHGVTLFMQLRIRGFQCSIKDVLPKT